MIVAAIVGSRRGLNWALVSRELQRLIGEERIAVVVSGGALGVDRLAETIALTLGKRVKVYPPEWQKFGKSAGYRRNVQIVEAADEVFAFWDGESRGTQHTIDIARQAGKPVHVWRDGIWCAGATLSSEVRR